MSRWRALLARAGARVRPAAEDAAGVALADVQRRLELFLGALYGRRIAVQAREPLPRPWWARLRPPGPAHLRGTDELPGADAERIWLPRRLPAPGGSTAEAVARYELLAVEQAERLVRGTGALLPPARSALERDLYLVLEGAAVDRAIAASLPGLRRVLLAERAAALARRPDPAGLTPAEREVERLVRETLAGDPEAAAEGSAPADSLARALSLAEPWRGARPAYRGIAPVAPWGEPVLPPTRLRATVRPEAPMEAGARSDPIPTGAVAPTRAESDLRANRRNGDRPGPAPGDPPDPAAGGDAEPEGGGNGSPAEGGAPTAGGAAGAGAAARAPAPGGIAYPEWDWRAGAYRRPGAVVRDHPGELGDEREVAELMRGREALVRRVREQFERLRARRVRLYSRRDGDELDLAAVVRAAAELRAGRSADDRLYTATRATRRELAITLLVDISGSTSTVVGRTRIIELEKLALLLTGEALDALGDRYSILTFSGTGADNVRVRTVKHFHEPAGAAVRRRVAALRPEGYTRLGAAVRHATALLGRQGTRHRLLLLLSDGRPADDDHYTGRFGVEDSRQAIAEARASGVYPFCLTVDRTAAAYLPRIFGAGGHTVLHHPEHLPAALLRVVRDLLRSP